MYPSLPPSQKLLKKLAIYSLVISDHSMPVTPLEQKKRMQRVNTIILFCTTDKLQNYLQFERERQKDRETIE